MWMIGVWTPLWQESSVRSPVGSSARAGRCCKRHGSGRGRSAGELEKLRNLVREERVCHASLIAAQWELRMIASPSMLETAERLAVAAEHVRGRCGSGAQFREAWEQHWLPARDDFIAAARGDLDVEDR